MILGLSVEMVRTYRKTMMRKLRVSNIASVTQLTVATGVAVPSAPMDGQTAGVSKPETKPDKLEIESASDGRGGVP